MHPQQPPNGPYQGGYPQQPPNGPYQGGYPQQPVPYGGHFPSGPVRMPGAAVAVRVLMFIGGVCGLLFGGLLWLAAAMASGDSRFSEEFMQGVQEGAGFPISSTDAGLLFALVGAIPFVYGVLSTLLAALMGRRSAVVLWSVVVFQALAALTLVFNTVTGAVGSVVPLAFAVLMIVLMLLGGTRAYYTRSAPAAY
ncbi:proline-rich domain-containing protein [Nocardiopsis deserti]|uniref:proline-rich domain-containing protein n=1 Tax=Nocardiopsis deserti TaxID=2605988 RepID=UPI00123A91BB|nr:proline-rich domain-containing protein [Nocardiopsis deserti]